MKKLVVLATIVLAVGLSLVQSAAAQALSGRQPPDRPSVSIGYYKIAPGKQDEWLALYKRWHRPIMAAQLQAGTTLSSTVYALSSHQSGGNYDFAIINVAPAKPKPLGLSRGELIRKLFPDIEAYVAGERQRWTLTTEHWDTTLVEVDVDQDTPSVYYPLIDGRVVR